MEKIELLIPAGNEKSLRAAVNNGADAVYLGLSFNARKRAANFTKENINSIIKYCHNKNVRVYITMNVLVKNSEIKTFLEEINNVKKADAIIIQDPNLIPIIKKNFPLIKIHMSTQATITNSYAIPSGVDRVILPRELSLANVKTMSKKTNTEMFIHGALCFCYSGQCLFSSIAGARSGNRGMCAQPCRKKYNNKYLMSTKDLCLLEEIPTLIKTGVKSLKIEGRMRSPLYVQTVTKIYRKAIDNYYKRKFSIDKKDINDLKIVFNREFTKGYAYEKRIVDSAEPMNRGLYIGKFMDKKLELKEELSIGDGIAIWKKEKKGFTIQKITKNGQEINKAKPGDKIEIGYKAVDKTPVYKTKSVELKLELGKEINFTEPQEKKKKIIIPEIKAKENNNIEKIYVKVQNIKELKKAQKADVVYYDLMKENCLEAKKECKTKFYVHTPRIITDSEMPSILKKIEEIKPDGVLVANRGLIDIPYEKHYDYSLNTFNDIDIASLEGTPIISPELSLKNMAEIKNKNFIVLIHGDIVLMTTKEPLKAPELIDEEGRHFKVRDKNGKKEILNDKQIGLFNKIKKLQAIGIKNYYIEAKETDKWIRIYKKILAGEFDDTKIKKGYTTGHFTRGAY